MHISIIGSGDLGSTAAALLATAGHEVALSNSRGPDSLRTEVERLRPAARAVTPTEAAAFGDVVMVAIPFGRHRELPAEALAGRMVVDATNYHPDRDGDIDGLAAGRITSSELLAKLLTKSHMVKAFNTLNVAHLREGGSAPGAPGRLAIPHAGDDPEAKALVSRLIAAIGFDPLDTGSLAEGGRHQPPGSPLFNRSLTAAEARAEIFSSRMRRDGTRQRRLDAAPPVPAAGGGRLVCT